MLFGVLFFDSYWFFALPGLILAIYAQIKLSSTYAKYLEVPVQSGLSGADAAREILDRSGLIDVPVDEVPGHLSDHYDPIKKALFLSSENYHGRSLSAVGVAAHEAGHALQHQEAYAPLRIRMALVPVTSFASQAAFWIFFLGMFMNLMKLAVLGVIAYAIISVFQAITLPVEFDASRRAKAILLRLGIVQANESRGINQVLNAAALTYVAAMVESAMMLLRFVLMARDQDRD